MYSFAVMSPSEIDQAKAKLASYDKEQAAKKAAAAAAKAAIAPAPPATPPQQPETKA
jgi:hypothetical protein